MNVQITFRDIDPSDAIRTYVEKRAAKTLDTVDGVVSTRVVLARPHRHPHRGSSYRVTIDVVLPRDEVVVSPRDGAPGHADLYAAIDDAFDDLGRQLRDHAAKRARTA